MLAMDDTVTEIDFRPRPTAQRPLLGLTILVVEDSRYASEAVRLLSLRSGARIRRADCIESAERHLNVYRPSVAIVDLGLPDGSGADLIARMHGMRPRTPIILGTSGADPSEAEAVCHDAGADGFLPKPLESLAEFQTAILAHLPADLRPIGPRPLDVSEVTPDPIAFREDLAHVMDLLALDRPPLDYLHGFLLGVARTAHDGRLEDCAELLDPLAHDRGLSQAERHRVRALISRKIQEMPEPMRATPQHV
jgi:CheY-like chemotaxis protein